MGVSRVLCSVGQAYLNFYTWGYSPCLVVDYGDLIWNYSVRADEASPVDLLSLGVKCISHPLV